MLLPLRAAPCAWLVRSIISSPSLFVVRALCTRQATRRTDVLAVGLSSSSHHARRLPVVGDVRLGGRRGSCVLHRALDGDRRSVQFQAAT